MGVTAIKGAERNGKVIAAHAVAEDESIISITSDAQMVRSPVNQIGLVGRSAQGVRLVRLSSGAKLVSVSVCEGAGENADEAAPAVDETKEGDSSEASAETDVKNND
jgi:DNA gyrase subunit A